MHHDAMKEKEIKRIANSVTQVELVRNDAKKWELHFAVTYQEEKEVLTSYYAGSVREWLDVKKALHKVEELLPNVKRVVLIFNKG